MQGHVLQIEGARANRYHHHVDLTQQFLAWKSSKNSLQRSKIDLLESIQDSSVSYTKGEIASFQDFIWNKHLQLSVKDTSCPQDVILSNIEEKSKQLFPRHSKRSTDTKVMSLLHGHDVCFKAFKSRVVGNCDPQCSNCPTSDDNLHRLFTCPLFNSSFRDTLQQHSTSKQPSWSILGEQSKENSKALRCLAQLAITDET